MIDNKPVFTYTIYYKLYFSKLDATLKETLVGKSSCNWHRENKDAQLFNSVNVINGKNKMYESSNKYKTVYFKNLNSQFNSIY